MGVRGLEQLKWPDDYPEGHSPYCHKECDHPCHDVYDQTKENDAQQAND